MCVLCCVCFILRVRVRARVCACDYRGQHRYYTRAVRALRRWSHALPMIIWRPAHALLIDYMQVGFTDGPPSVETVTPTLDRLVAQGVRLERHYVHYTCTPTRSSIHSGRLPVRVTTKLSSPPGGLVSS